MHVPQRVIRPHGSLASRTKWLTQATIPTRHGEFETHVFQSAPSAPPIRDAAFAADGPGIPADTDPGPERLPREHVALIFGGAAALRAREDVLVRVHSECMTSEVFGSLKCDCKEQLDVAMAAVARAGAGAVLYLRQEGRGIGLANKIRAYALQSHGHDTVDANRMLGLPDDARSYEVARDMLSYFGIASVRLLTNNPTKVTGLRNLGVQVVGRLPIVVSPTMHSAQYLEAKRLRMDHDLPLTLSALRAASGDAE